MPKKAPYSDHSKINRSRDGAARIAKNLVNVLDGHSGYTNLKVRSNQQGDRHVKNP
jgi:hypothetical protein